MKASRGVRWIVAAFLAATLGFAVVGLRFENPSPLELPVQLQPERPVDRPRTGLNGQASRPGFEPSDEWLEEAALPLLATLPEEGEEEAWPLAELIPSDQQLQAKFEEMLPMGYEAARRAHDAAERAESSGPSADDPEAIEAEREIQEYLMNRDAVQASFAPAEIQARRVRAMSEVGMTAVYDDEQLLGLKVGSFGHGRGAYLKDMGLRENDIITRVNDRSAAGFGGGRVSLMREFAEAETLELEVMDGQGRIRHYIVD